MSIGTELLEVFGKDSWCTERHGGRKECASILISCFRSAKIESSRRMALYCHDGFEEVHLGTLLHKKL